MEIWKEIKGYESIYEISNKGNIRTAFGKKTFSTKDGIKTWKQKVLKQKLDKKTNSYKIALCKDRQSKTYLIARLVAYTFYNQDYNNHSKTVNHIDGNRLNNKLENLEIVTQKENVRHALLNNLFYSKKVYLKKTTENTLLEFSSYSSASRYLKQVDYFISRRIKQKKYIFQDYEIKEENNENMETKRVSYFFRD